MTSGDHSAGSYIAIAFGLSATSLLGVRTSLRIFLSDVAQFALHSDSEPTAFMDRVERALVTGSISCHGPLLPGEACIMWAVCFLGCTGAHADSVAHDSVPEEHEFAEIPTEVLHWYEEYPVVSRGQIE